MSPLIDRRTVLFTGLATSGSLWLPTLLRAADLPPGQLVIKNDYREDIDVAVYQPDTLDKKFETWAVRAGTDTPLQDRQHKPFIVGVDWGVGIRFGNGAESPIQRVINVAGGADQDGKLLCTASSVFNVKVGYSEDLYIKRTKGYTIDKRFGEKQAKLLTNALAVFYQRFVQLHWQLMPELFTKAGTRFADNFPAGDFKGVTEGRDFLGRQLGRIASSAGVAPNDGDIFPSLALNYANAPGAGWVARAPVGTVRVHLGRPEGRYEGTFEVQINDAYLFHRSGAYFSDQNFWAGVIAHEALHNLGHRHPDSRNDRGYHLYQMILIESLVMSGGTARYGQKGATPVMCGGQPR